MPHAAGNLRKKAPYQIKHALVQYLAVKLLSICVIMHHHSSGVWHPAIQLIHSAQAVGKGFNDVNAKIISNLVAPARTQSSSAISSLLAQSSPLPLDQLQLS